MNVKYPALTESRELLWSEECGKIGRLCQFWMEVLRTCPLFFFFSLSYAPSILHKNKPRHPRASPGPLNENQTWEKKEQMEDPSPTKPSQARPTSEILVFAVSTEILRLSAEH